MGINELSFPLLSAQVPAGCLEVGQTTMGIHLKLEDLVQLNQAVTHGRVVEIIHR